MGSFLLIVVAAIVLSGIVFGAAAFTLGRDRGLTPPRPDGVPFDLPADRPLDRADVEDLRFDTAIRGYRMDQVDEILRRVADDFDFLHARIIDLEDQLATSAAADEEEDERPFAFPWDAEERAEAPADPTAPPADAVAGSVDGTPEPGESVLSSVKPATASAKSADGEIAAEGPPAAEGADTPPASTVPTGTEPTDPVPADPAAAAEFAAVARADARA
ncbi:DivIVA domain-containing protein, partial [Cryptosporangium minutisporangium]|uniref:DivIVA domain-containing protein n=1 Tax=Cryptosporangium minutisporangium TaxID=113569 RepID=UPI0031E6F63F